jgi:hypothetical protein
LLLVLVLLFLLNLLVSVPLIAHEYSPCGKWHPGQALICKSRAARDPSPIRFAICGTELAPKSSTEANHMKTTKLLLAALATLGAAACSDPDGDERGLDMRSRGTGERNERLGNDPAEQNTGEGSNPENEPAPQAVPQR